MVLAALLRAGKTVLQPFGDNQRYDIVIDEGGKFFRIQCKTGRVRDGAIRFSTCSVRYDQSARSYVGEIELFGVYCPETDKVYLVPIAEASTITETSLRTEAPKNGQKARIRMAKDFELTGALPNG